MSSPDPYSLDQLHDIVEPAPIDAWPPAAGFWFLAALLLVWLLAAALIAWQRHRRNRYRRAALAQLQSLAKRQLHGDGNPLAELSALLKRTALAAYPREQVAALTGDDWLQFLDCSANTDHFRNGPAARLASAGYHQPPPADANTSTAQTEAIFTAAAHWIRHHRPADRPGSEPQC